MDTKYTDIKLSDFQKNEIETKMKELKGICQMYGVPMFASVVCANSEDNTDYLRIVHAAQSHAITLKKDEIRKHMLIANDFDIQVVPKREILTVSASDDFFNIKE